MLIHPDLNDSLCVLVEADPTETWLLEGSPARFWDKKIKRWVLPILPNIDFLRSNFKRPEFAAGAIEQIKELLSKKDKQPSWKIRYIGVPMAHQRKALELAANKLAFFFAHATGAGKSYVILNLAYNLYLHEGLRGLVVVCPASIREDVWRAQTDMWLGQAGIQYAVHVLRSGRASATDRFIKSQDHEHGLRVLVLSVQSLSNGDGMALKLARQFIHSAGACAMVVDESSRIKRHDAKRTENTIELGQLARWRWAATGTKITQGVHDLYSQYRYLDWHVLGHKSFYTFRNRYCIMGGFEGKAIVGYQNMGQLLELIKPVTHEVRKEDANELPPKVYEVRHIEASAEQKKVYNQLRLELKAESGDDVLSVKNALDRMTRYQQISGGNFPFRGYDKEWHTRPLKANPKLAELMDLLDDCDDKAIIWARFTAEIEAITQSLEKAFGPDSAVAYYGPVSVENRTKNIEKFRTDPKCRFFVANQATAGMGLTLVEATLVVYFSNSFSLEDRWQSEDRCHRTGQTKSVTYVDILSDLPIDGLVQKALASKGSMAIYVSNNLANVDGPA